MSAPPAYALKLLEEALALTPDGVPYRKEYLLVRESLWQHLGRPDEGPLLEDMLPPLEPGERRRYLEESRKLAIHPLFRTWIPEFHQIKPWLEKLREVQDSPLVLTEAQQQMRQEMVVDEAAAALFPPGERQRWGRRVLKMAYFLHLKGQADNARAARAAGEDLLAEDRGPLAGECPLLQELVKYSLLLALEYLKQQEPQSQPSLLVTPP